MHQVLRYCEPFTRTEDARDGEQLKFGRIGPTILARTKEQRPGFRSGPLLWIAFKNEGVLRREARFGVVGLPVSAAEQAAFVVEGEAVVVSRVC
jgi:hypothetical protein